MPVSTRLATEADAAALAELAAITFPLACPPESTAEAKSAFIAEHLSLDRFRDYLADDAYALVVAGDEGELVGYTMLVFVEPHDADVVTALRIRPTVELSKFYVLPGHHGAGTAAELMAHTLRAAIERDADGIWLGVNQENARAQRFYTKHGFERVGIKHFLLGDRVEDDFVFERTLVLPVA